MTSCFCHDLRVYVSIVGLLTYFTFFGVGPEKRGKLVEWVEKASFDRLNRLFEIEAVERSCDILLSTQNLRSVMREP